MNFKKADNTVAGIFWATKSFVYIFDRRGAALNSTDSRQQIKAGR